VPLPDGEKFISTEYTNVTDRQTDRQTDCRRTLHDGIGRAYAYHRAAKILRAAAVHVRRKLYVSSTVRTVSVVMVTASLVR